MGLVIATRANARGHQYQHQDDHCSAHPFFLMAPALSRSLRRTIHVLWQAKQLYRKLIRGGIESLPEERNLEAERRAGAGQQISTASLQRQQNQPGQPGVEAFGRQRAMVGRTRRPGITPMEDVDQQLPGFAWTLKKSGPAHWRAL